MVKRTYQHLPEATVRGGAPQTVQAHPAQVPNSAGGWSFPVDKWTQARRFLILGSDDGTYYISERELTLTNAKAIQACLIEDGKRLVELIVQVSRDGLAPKNDPAIFALAMAAAPQFAPPATRYSALAALPLVCRTATHLFQFVEIRQSFGGWNRSLRWSVENWYHAWGDARYAAYQLIKYRQRDGWTHKNVLQLAHPHPEDVEMHALFRWAIGAPLGERIVKRNSKQISFVAHTPGARVGDKPSAQATAEIAKSSLYPDITQPLHPLIKAFASVQALGEIKDGANVVEDAVKLIQEFDLPREALPTQFLNEPDVWAALLENMPYHALTRNLGVMSAVGLLDREEAQKLVIERLGNEKALRKARLHPIAILNALKVYAQGQGDKGHKTWKPNRHIIDALDRAFYAAFGNLTATGKKILVGVDVSGSMAHTQVVGLSQFQAREAAGALALVTLATEHYAEAIAFDTAVHDLPISPRQRLDDVVNVLARTGGGGTDCSLPITYAQEKNRHVDLFMILTDSETWHGVKDHPFQALKEYRKRVNPGAKLAVVALCANQFTIGDLNDAGTLNLVGFDLGTPQLLAAFAGDEI